MKSLIIKKNSLYQIIFATTVFILSLLVLPYYVGGDQFYYASLYNKYENATFDQIIPIGLKTISASEPFSLGLYWLGANIGIERILYESSLNALLSFQVARLALKNNVKFYIVTLMIFNSYLFAVYFSAVRLKICLIILLFLHNSSYKIIKSMAFLSILGHYSIALMLVGNKIVEKVKSNSQRLETKKFHNILSILILSVLILSVSDYIVSKTLVYFQWKFVFVDFVKTIVLIFLVFLTLNIRYAIAYFLGFYPFIFLFGSGRVLMLLVVSFVYHLIKLHKTENLYFIIFLFYGFVKSMQMFSNIYLYGDGFYAG